MKKKEASQWYMKYRKCKTIWMLVNLAIQICYSNCKCFGGKNNTQVKVRRFEIITPGMFYFWLAFGQCCTEINFKISI